jgi:molybdopterin-containing oxidoreductase family iron-sulfur binding subunit
MSQTEITKPSPAAGPDPGTTYWRSLDELQLTPQFEEFLHREFPQAASEFPKGMSRRRWLQLMGASLSLAGVAGCRWQTEDFLPAATRVPDYIPGEPQVFATLHELRGFARGLLVRNFDGRPIKIEGNPDHPQSHGAADVFAQGCILDLYDPDRIGRPLEFEGTKATERTWEQIEESIRALVGRAGDGAKLRVLAGASSSPSRQRLEQSLLARFPQAKWIEYEPISRQSIEQGAQLAFGQRLRPHYKFDAANVILVVDGDPFGADPDQINHARGWATRRAPEDGEMNRMYVVESQYSSTGTAADHREAVASSRIPQFLDELEAAIGEAEGGGKPKSENVFIRALSQDLADPKNRGKSLIYVGPRQAANVHARVHRLNGRLGNLGQTIVFTEETNPERAPYAEAIASLAEDMKAGNVDTLLILRGNPVYDAPVDVEFAAALEKVSNSIHVSEYRNETTRHCRWYLPATHALEQWGDGRSYDGTLTLQQPLIAPLHGGRSELEILALLLGDGPRDGEKIVHETFTANAGEDQWRKVLHDGFVEKSAPEPVEASAQEGPADGAAGPKPLAKGEYEIVFCESEHVYDGRFANNGWLQEVPAFLSKLTWDNAAIISVNDAIAIGVEFQDVVRITVGDRSIEMPVYVLPGQADGSIGVALGYGRTAAGLIGGFEGEDEEQRAPSVGVDVNTIRTTKAMSFVTGAKVEKTGGTHPLATTQDHFAIDPIGLAEIVQRVPLLVREYTQDIFNEKKETNPDFVSEAVHHPPLESLWTSPDYSKDHAWGMAIDLTKCIGCNACVVACQSENNVPIVGKQQVLAGREMHWLRIDRYFRGNPGGRTPDKAGPAVVGQPVLCMHCEHAPCEQVCPVAAAVLDHEGLNLMVYNRCVGTRYCNNNCPYKVRRFNFFNWYKQPVNKKYRSLNVLGLDGEKHLEDSSQNLAAMVFNPEVTVRSRGVMEKCTYCQQRIAAAKIEARNHNVHSEDPAVRKSLRVQDGAVQTACQQTCPTDAIAFGDLLDEKSRVHKLHYMRQRDSKAPPHIRSYGMLSELNVRPRTAYLARIKNPHPLLAENEAYAIPPLGHAPGHHDTPGEHETERHS